MAILHDHGIQVNGSFVLGFDHDREDVFDRTVAWIEAARLECATFHILTPYPGTPLFRAMESEGRLAAQELEPLRHVARRLSAPAHDAGRAGGGLRLVLRSPVLAPLDLAAEAGRLAGRAAVPGDVVPLQAIESPLAPLDPPPPDRPGLAAPGRMDQAEAPAVPSPARALGPLRRPPHGGIGRVGGSLSRPGLAPGRAETQEVKPGASTPSAKGRVKNVAGTHHVPSMMNGTQTPSVCLLRDRRVGNSGSVRV